MSSPSSTRVSRLQNVKQDTVLEYLSSFSIFFFHQNDKMLCCCKNQDVMLGAHCLKYFYKTYREKFRVNHSEILFWNV